MRKSAKIITALSAAGLAVAAGSAFTNSNTAPANTTLGYSTTTVSGATVTSLDYNLNASGETINSATLVLDGDTTGSAVSMNYNNGTSFTCGTGAFDSLATATTYTCTQSQSTAGLTSTGIVVN
jgi:hypothetical protein